MVSFNVAEESARRREARRRTAAASRVLEEEFETAAAKPTPPARTSPPVGGPTGGPSGPQNPGTRRTPPSLPITAVPKPITRAQRVAVDLQIERRRATQPVPTPKPAPTPTTEVIAKASRLGPITAAKGAQEARRAQNIKDSRARRIEDLKTLGKDLVPFWGTERIARRTATDFGEKSVKRKTFEIASTVLSGAADLTLLGGVVVRGVGAVVKGGRGVVVTSLPTTTAREAEALLKTSQVVKTPIKQVRIEVTSPQAAKQGADLITGVTRAPQIRQTKVLIEAPATPQGVQNVLRLDNRVQRLTRNSPAEANRAVDKNTQVVLKVERPILPADVQRMVETARRGRVRQVTIQSRKYEPIGKNSPIRDVLSDEQIKALEKARVQDLKGTAKTLGKELEKADVRVRFEESIPRRQTKNPKVVREIQLEEATHGGGWRGAGGHRGPRKGGPWRTPWHYYEAHHYPVYWHGAQPDKAHHFRGWAYLH